jgi:hypothetical protein
MTKDEFIVTITIGFAAQEIADNAMVIVKAMGQKFPALKEHLGIIDQEASVTLAGELANVMYEAACATLVSKGLAYPPLRPEVFMAMETMAENLREKRASGDAS